MLTLCRFNCVLFVGLVASGLAHWGFLPAIVGGWLAAEILDAMEDEE